MEIWSDKTRQIREKIAKIEEPLMKSLTKGAVERFPPDIQGMIAKLPTVRLPLETQLVELAWRQVDYDQINLESKLKGQAKEEMVALRRELAKHESLKPAPLAKAQSIVETGTVAAYTPHPKKRGVPSHPVLSPCLILRMPWWFQQPIPPGGDPPWQITW